MVAGINLSPARGRMDGPLEILGDLYLDGQIIAAGPLSVPLLDTGGAWLNAKASPWGAKGDGVTDDTAALQGVLDAAAALSAPVFVPAGNYIVSATLGRTSMTGLILCGAGASLTAAPGPRVISTTAAWDSQGTRFTWKGDAISPMFSFGDLRSSILERFVIGCDVSFPLLCGIELFSISSASPRGASTTPTRNVLSRISMDGTTSGLMYGVRWAGPLSEHAPVGAQDANNDFTTLQFVEVANHGGVAFSIDHSQAYGELFIQCTANGGSNALGQAGIACGAFYDGAAWTSGIGGTFEWYGGAMGRHQQADLVFGTPQGSACIVDGLISENSVRLVSFPAHGATQGDNNGGPLLLRGLRWGHAGSIAADKYFIDYHAPGPLVLNGCAILDSTPGNALKIRLVAGSTGLQTLRVQDSVIESSAADNDLYDLAGANGANSKVYISGNRRLNRAASNVISRWTDE